MAVLSYDWKLLKVVMALVNEKDAALPQKDVDLDDLSAESFIKIKGGVQDASEEFPS